MICMIPDIFTFLTAVDVAATAPAGILERLSGMAPDELMHAVTALAVSVAWKLVKLLVIWFLGRWITRRAVNVIRILMEKRNVNLSVRTFVSSLVDVVAMIILIVMIIVLTEKGSGSIKTTTAFLVYQTEMKKTIR